MQDTRRTIVLAATVAVACATLPLLWWHVQFFRVAGDGYFQLLLGLLPVLFVAPLAWRYLQRWEWPLLLGLPCLIVASREPRLFVFGGLFALACWGLGDAVLQQCGVNVERPLRRLALGFATGQSLFGLLLFGLGLSGLLQTAILAMLPVAGLLLAWRSYRLGLPKISFSAAEGLPAITGFFALIFGGLAAAAVVTPVWSGDSVRFHLALAKIYAQAGGLVAPQFEAYGFYPQAFELLLAWSLQLGGPAAPQALPAIQFLVVLVLVYECGRATGLSRNQACTATLLCATLPFVHWSGVTLKNDMMLAVYQLSGVVLFLEWQLQRRLPTLLFAALLAAAGFTVKHTALFGAVAMAPFLLYGLWHSRPRLLAFGLAALLVCGTGPIYQFRTWQLRGSPTYPEVAQRAVTHGGHEEAGVAHAIARYFEIPYSTHFRGRLHFESPSNNPVGVAIILLLTAALSSGRLPRNAVALTLAIFTGLYFAYWGTILSVLRYAIVPSLLLVSLLWRRAKEWLWPPMLSYVFVFALLVCIVQELHPQLPGYLLHRVSREQLLAAQLPPYSSAEFLRRQAKQSERILSIGNWAIAYLPFPDQVQHIYTGSRTYTGADLQPLAQTPFQWLILPVDGQLTELEAAATALVSINLHHSDPYFRVYQVSPKAH